MNRPADTAPPGRPNDRAGRLRAWLQWLGEGNGGAGAGHRLPRFFLLFLLLFGAGMILISLIGDQGLIAYYMLRQEARTLRADVERQEARRINLRHEIRALRNDPAYIEHLARKRLGLVKPGEVVLELKARESEP